MRKRERENPCFICGHYHRYEEGEICNICGHQPPQPSAPKAPSAYPSEILPDFLYLGTYDHSVRLRADHRRTTNSPRTSARAHGRSQSRAHVRCFKPIAHRI